MPGAAELLARLNRDDKPYFIVTNDASKLPATAASRYQRFGLPIDASRILTSGMLLTGHFADRGLRGRRCAVLGPADSARYVADAGGEVVPPDEAFDVLVIGDESGFPFLDWADAALSSLFVSIDAGRPVHLVVPNPDLIYPGGGGFGFAAGTIANMFEGALSLRYPDRPELRFARLGKPNTPIFEDAIRRLGTSRAVMVGDTLETDIAGARAAGLDAVWIETGVTRPSRPPRRSTCVRHGACRASCPRRRRASGERRDEGLPIGPEVAAHEASRPSRTRLEGRDVVLVPIDVAAHGPQLYALSHGPEREAQWMYLWDGPYPSQDAFLENLAIKAASEDPFFFSILDAPRGTPSAWRPTSGSRRRIG